MLTLSNLQSFVSVTRVLPLIMSGYNNVFIGLWRLRVREEETISAHFATAIDLLALLTKALMMVPKSVSTRRCSIPIHRIIPSRSYMVQKSS